MWELIVSAFRGAGSRLGWDLKQGQERQRGRGLKGLYVESRI